MLRGRSALELPGISESDWQLSVSSCEFMVSVQLTES